MLKRILLAAPAFSLMTGLFIFSGFSDPVAPDLGFELQDKLGHFAAYFILGAALQPALIALFPKFASSKSENRPKIGLCALALIVGAIYAATDELHQAFVPGRNSDFFDWIADVLGIAVSCVLTKFFLKKLSGKFLE